MVAICPLLLSKPVLKKAKKRCAHFYFVILIEKEAWAGFVCRVQSPDKSKFKLLYFDRDESDGLCLARHVKAKLEAISIYIYVGVLFVDCQQRSVLDLQCPCRLSGLSTVLTTLFGKIQVKELPPEFYWSTREYYATAIRATRIKMAPVHASANWSLENFLPVLLRYGIAAIAPFSHRLAFGNVSLDIQRLRCKVNFKALVLVPHVSAIGDALVSRLQNPAYKRGPLGTDMKGKQGSGKFVVLHLRFDKDRRIWLLIQHATSVVVKQKSWLWLSIDKYFGRGGS